MIGMRPRSIRFKLTAWYAGILALSLVVFAFLIATLIERRLTDNFDPSLNTAANQILQNAHIQPGIDGESVQLIMPSFDPFSIAGYFIQVYSTDGRTIYQSDNLGERDLPFWTPEGGSSKRTFHNIDIEDESLRLLNVPLGAEGFDSTIAVFVIASSTSQNAHTVSEVRQTIFIGSVVAFVVIAFGGWILAGRSLRPVERMRGEAAAITSDRGSARPILAERIKDPGTNDEISRLAQTFNELLDRIEAAFDTERRFIADASHELRTPLTAIRGNVDVLLRQADRIADFPPEQREALTDMQREASRMSRLLQDLLTLARADTASSDDLASRSPISLAEPLASAVRTAQALAPDREIVADLRGDPWVTANPDQIEQVALILLDNAIRHSSAPSTVTLRLQRSSQDAEIVVIDRGEGIAPEHLPHLFDRFYRVDSARSRRSGGTGLGLAIAHSIVLRHGGEIDVLSSPGIGTTFTIMLPLAAHQPDVPVLAAG
jgi:heavy metal sensor kinase